MEIRRARSVKQTVEDPSQFSDIVPVVAVLTDWIDFIQQGHH
jgi:hypothetical protein